MEKLSIEQKAKRYDELLVKLQKAKVDNNACDERYCCVIDDIVPELKESEGEKIRKEIITHIKWCEDVGYCSKEEMIRWITFLEKQGEQKPVKKEDWCFEKGEWYVKLCHDYEGDLRHFQEGHVYQAVSETSITDGYHHVSLGSWQIPKYFRPATKEEIPQEQKPVEPQQDMLSQEQYAKAVDECVYGELKPAWSEEDDKNLEKAIWYVEKGGKLIFAKTDKLVPWLKSIKDRVQPKQEWSEEDSKMVDDIVKNLKKYQLQMPDYRVELQMRWLNYLKFIYTWKPSDEQMDAIKDAIDYLGCNTKKVREYLMSLYERLKKLREE